MIDRLQKALARLQKEQEKIREDIFVVPPSSMEKFNLIHGQYEGISRAINIILPILKGIEDEI